MDDLAQAVDEILPLEFHVYTLSKVLRSIRTLRFRNSLGTSSSGGSRSYRPNCGASGELNVRDGSLIQPGLGSFDLLNQ